MIAAGQYNFGAPDSHHFDYFFTKAHPKAEAFRCGPRLAIDSQFSKSGESDSQARSSHAEPPIPRANAGSQIGTSAMAAATQVAVP